MNLNNDKKYKAKDYTPPFRFLSIKKKKKIVGRGDKTAGRGTKGQKSRKSGNVRLGFEGGQNPFYRRFSKRGFNKKKNSHVSHVSTINLGDIEKDDNILSDSLLDFSEKKDNIKVLGNGFLTKKLKIISFSFSFSSIKKIEEAGGTAIFLKKN